LVRQFRELTVGASQSVTKIRSRSGAEFPKRFGVRKELRMPRYHGYRLFRVLMSDCFAVTRVVPRIFKIRP